MSVQYHNDTELLSALAKVNVLPASAADTVTPVSLTAALTTVTHTAPSTPDYAVQDLTITTPYGFVTADEGNSVLKVIANLQVRVNELEAQLILAGILA